MIFLSPDRAQKIKVDVNQHLIENLGAMVEITPTSKKFLYAKISTHSKVSSKYKTTNVHTHYLNKSITQQHTR